MGFHYILNPPRIGSVLLFLNLGEISVWEVYLLIYGRKFSFTSKRKWSRNT